MATLLRKCCGLMQLVHRRTFAYKPVKRPSLIKEGGKSSRSEPNAESLDLATILQTKIKAAGPISLADYMRNVLTNPNGGYYMERDVFGEGGDFITSPEVAQIFGELIAVWCLTEWRKIGSPSPVQLIELGPGRGTLSRDILRVFSQFKLGDQFSLHLVEVSPYLSKVQAQQLCFNHSEVDPESNEPFYRQGETVSGAKVFWYHKLEDVPKEFSIVLAHEFFDALPVHKMQYDKGLWREVMVDVDPSEEKKFRFVLSNNQTVMSKVFQPLEGESRETLEYSLEADAIIQRLAHWFEFHGGFALIIDYGHLGDKSDTFRAFKQHKLHDPLLNPGAADLTADVDFKRLKFVAEANGCLTFGPVSQQEFLKRMEAEARLKVLLEKAQPEAHEALKSGYDMLTHPDKMGSRFKFLSIFPQVLKEHLKKFPVNGFS
ncbi:protein arginine methyltransferase NDUFAF7 homolog, mitochondrial isoform X2 [Hermetia illucens]|nr:protein arginine methyltransferase NDUFAF7 homolog, mitochondrial isoform X2 [Hermetia illucens]